jgi:hypothetical protein
MARAPLTLTPYAMAYGRPGALGKARGAARPAVNLDDYLLAEAKNPRAPRPMQRPVAARPAPAMVALPPEPMVAASDSALQSIDSSVDASEIQLAAAEPPKAPGLERYASRAQSDRDLLKFQGGDAIVITASTLVVILLIVLILVLLT